MGQRWTDDHNHAVEQATQEAQLTKDSTNFPSVAGQLLVAMPSLMDPTFGGTVVFVAEHNPQGAMGIVVNRPADMSLASLFARIDLKPETNDLCAADDGSDTPVMIGGPVQTDRGFVLHEPVGQWSSTLRVAGGLPEIGLTSSRDILEATAKGQGPDRLLVALGYSGWGEGQLDAELAANAWLTVPLHDADVLFSVAPEERLNAAFAMLGVDPLNLSGAVGHA
jgi:putative transcriptional regulator